jgi:hypothetical protein
LWSIKDEEMMEETVHLKLKCGKETQSMSIVVEERHQERCIYYLGFLDSNPLPYCSQD